MSNASITAPLQEGIDDGVNLMELVLKKTGSGYLYQSHNLDLLRWGNLPESVRQRATQTDADESIFGSENGARLASLKRIVLEKGEPMSLDVELPSATGMLTYRVDLERVEAPGLSGVLSVITDISETHHRERVLKTLLREVSHRSKNLLAIIQGIATQTARQALSLECFLATFRGRIQSLSYSQDLVTDSSWRGAYLFALAERQFGTYWPDPESPIEVTGVNAHLSPNATLHIGLALHELIVNSASHGAIAAGVNSLTIDCFETMLENGKAIEISWIEHLPPTDHREAEDQNFGRTVLERVVPIAVGGKALYLTAPDRIEYRLTVPSKEYEIITRVEE